MPPWRTETFKFSTDPELVAKISDIIGLYLAPPENAIVLCVDEKSQIRRWIGPRRCCRCSPVTPSGAPHDYIQHAITTLFAAVAMAKPGRGLVGIIERQAVRRGTFRSVRELTARIRQFIDGWN